ncbi:apiosidase-like domain-containing protein, partial [Actinacidiphila bryophytorum]
MPPIHASAWRQVEITLQARTDHPAPYNGVEVWADFTHTSGLTMRRPAFWDGGNVWRIRFASPLPEGRWSWRSGASVVDEGLAGAEGQVTMDPVQEGEGVFRQHGFWRMSPGGRNLVHADGTPALLVADTAWALPWRATEEHVRVYAADRRAKGFNAVLMMSVQPDMHARGPRDRTADEGFDVAFEDLPSGRLGDLVPAYFQQLDRLLAVLDEYGIVPVLQPVFQGWGWKGLSAAGGIVPPEEYARYCRYLVARYGAAPAIWLVGADGTGEEPQVEAGGREIQQWDAYGQPCGIHYQPDSLSRAHQDADWLDFQWCQTGHRGEHVPERVADLWRNLPAKAVANGEPTYEHSGRRGKAEGWWQGHEAWSNLCAGGTMGVVYGAGSLWQWRLHAQEQGHEDYFVVTDAGWREALDFDGSTYVGLVGRILASLPISDMRPSWELALAPRGLLVPGLLYIGYAENGGRLQFRQDGADLIPRTYRIVDPRTGQLLASGRRSGADATIEWDEGAPAVYICCD